MFTSRHDHAFLIRNMRPPGCVQTPQLTDFILTTYSKSFLAIADKFSLTNCLGDLRGKSFKIA